MSEEENVAENTDVEIYQAPDNTAGQVHETVFVTKDGQIGMNHWGSVVVKPLGEWVAYFWQQPALDEKPQTFESELESLINRYSKENDSNTPDFILAEYLTDCLATWTKTTKAREKWYGKELKINNDSLTVEFAQAYREAQEAVTGFTRQPKANEVKIAQRLLDKYDITPKHKYDDLVPTIKEMRGLVNFGSTNCAEILGDTDAD